MIILRKAELIVETSIIVDLETVVAHFSSSNCILYSA